MISEQKPDTEAALIPIVEESSLSNQSTSALAITEEEHIHLADLKKVSVEIDGRRYISRNDLGLISQIKIQALRKTAEKYYDFGIIIGEYNAVLYNLDKAIDYLHDQYRIKKEKEKARLARTSTTTDTLTERIRTPTGYIERKRVLKNQVQVEKYRERERKSPSPRIKRPIEQYSIDEGRKAFKLLDEGLTPNTVLQKMRIHPTTMDVIWKDWTKLRSGFVVEGAIRETIDFLFRNLLNNESKPMMTQADLRDNLIAVKGEIFTEDEMQRAVQCARCIHKGRVANKAEVCLRCANDISDQLLLRRTAENRKPINFESMFREEKGKKK